MYENLSDSKDLPDKNTLASKRNHCRQRYLKSLFSIFYPGFAHPPQYESLALVVKYYLDYKQFERANEVFDLFVDDLKSYPEKQFQELVKLEYHLRYAINHLPKKDPNRIRLVSSHQRCLKQLMFCPTQEHFFPYFLKCCNESFCQTDKLGYIEIANQWLIHSCSAEVSPQVQNSIIQTIINKTNKGGNPVAEYILEKVVTLELCLPPHLKLQCAQALLKLMKKSEANLHLYKDEVDYWKLRLIAYEGEMGQKQKSNADFKQVESILELKLEDYKRICMNELSDFYDAFELIRLCRIIKHHYLKFNPSCLQKDWRSNQVFLLSLMRIPTMTADPIHAANIEDFRKQNNPIDILCAYYLIKKDDNNYFSAHCHFNDTHVFKASARCSYMLCAEKLMLMDERVLKVCYGISKSGLCDDILPLVENHMNYAINEIDEDEKDREEVELKRKLILSAGATILKQRAVFARRERENFVQGVMCRPQSQLLSFRADPCFDKNLLALIGMFNGGRTIQDNDEVKSKAAPKLESTGLRKSIS